MTALNNDHASSSSSNSLSSLPAPSSSSTSLNIDSPHMHKPSPPPRHIRFAPLLDPRRAVVVTDDGHELPIKDDTHFPAATSLSVLQNNTPTSQTQKQPVTCSDPDSPLQHSTSASPSPLSAFSSPTDLQTSSSSTPYSPGPQSRTFTVDILKHPPGPTKQKPRKSKSLSISPEEILTLGTINLFRSSTLSSDQDNFKENNDPASTSSSHRHSLVGGWGLLRRTSGTPSSSVNTTETEILGSNPPLTRVQEGSDRKKRRSSIAAFFSAAPGVSSLVEKTKSQRAKAKGTPATASSSSVSGTPSSGSTITNARPATTRTSLLPSSQRAPRHKGARMLNGRIYGAKPNNHISENPFANARDDEPEFVEWGYGGMGSVKGARSAGVVGNNNRGAVNWERLLGGSEVSGQGGNTGFMVPGGGRGGAGARRRQGKEEPRERRSGEADEEEKGGEDGEEDDGSGLAWIRKRRKIREEKEKEKRMKETEQTHKVAPGSEAIPTSPSALGPQVTDSATQTTIKPSDHDRNLSHSGPRKAGQNDVDEHRHANSSQDTGTSNVNGHHDHVMKAVSVPMPRMKVSPHHRRTFSRGVLQDEEAENGAMIATADDHDNGKLKDVSQQKSQTQLVGSESSSTSSSESSGDESDSDGEDSSGEDQDENESEKRRTAIGAGVEKVTASFRHRGE